MAAPKQRTKFGFMAAVEAAYGVAETLATADDGVLLMEPPIPDTEYLYDGARGRAPGTAGRQTDATPAGLGFTCETVLQAHGAATAYSASDVPPGIHQMLQSAGMQATGDFTGGSEKYTYAPESGPTGYSSITVEAYINGEKHPGRGCYSTFTITGDGVAAPSWAFELSGIGTLPTDAAVPTITSYPAAANLPPKAQNISLSIGSGTPFTGGVVRSFTFTLNRELSSRLDANSTDGHAGFTPGPRDPQLEIVIEQVARATSTPYYTATTIDPDILQSLKTQLAVSFTVGSTQYERWTLTLPQAQIVEVEDGEDGATALWTITFSAKVSAGSADDDFNIVFD